MKKLFMAVILCITLLPCRLVAQDETPVLEMIGYTSASLIYTAHEYMGKLHDGFDYDCFEKSDIISQLDAQINLLDGAADQYQKVIVSGWLKDDADVKSIREIKRCCQLLKRQAEALKVLVENDYESSPDQYNDLRDESWELIKKILQIE